VIQSKAQRNISLKRRETGSHEAQREHVCFVADTCPPRPHAVDYKEQQTWRSARQVEGKSPVLHRLTRETSNKNSTRKRPRSVHCVLVDNDFATLLSDENTRDQAWPSREACKAGILLLYGFMLHCVPVAADCCQQRWDRHSTTPGACHARRGREQLYVSDAHVHVDLHEQGDASKQCWCVSSAVTRVL
jgi:hypothetical protein